MKKRSSKKNKKEFNRSDILKERTLYVVVSDKGFMSGSIFCPRWTSQITYDTKKFVRKSFAQKVVNKTARKETYFRKNRGFCDFGNAQNLEVAEIVVQYVGTVSDIAERELLGEQDKD